MTAATQSVPAISPEAAQAAQVAIWRLLRRIETDPRIAHYFCPLTQSFEDLTEAHALMTGQDVAAYRQTYGATLQFEAPPPRADELIQAAETVLTSEYCSFYRLIPPFTDLEHAVARAKGAK